MAESKAAKAAWMRDILYKQWRKNVWLNLCNRDSEAAFQMVNTINFIELADNIQGDRPADRDALETALAYSTADLDVTKMERKWIRRNAALNLDDVISAGAGENLDARLNELLAGYMMVDIDDIISNEVFNVNYAAVSGDIETDGSKSVDNLLVLGDATNYVPATFPYEASTDEAMQLVFDALVNSSLLLAEKGLYDSNFVGSGAPQVGSCNTVMPFGLATQLVKWLVEKGALDLSASAGRQAAEGLGIFGTSAYMGTAGDSNIIASRSVPRATAANPWAMYTFLPDSSVAGAISPPILATRDARDGTTNGEFVRVRDGWQRCGGKVVRPGHVVKATIHQKPSGVEELQQQETDAKREAAAARKAAKAEAEKAAAEAASE